MRRSTGRAGGRVGSVFLHACGEPAADAAERDAVASLFPSAATSQTTQVFGTFAAAGGFNLAAAALAARSTETVLLSASSWGGGLAALTFRSASLG
jgi:3-oxoacyl-(acyl-carrier-protein) synthase